MPPGLAPRFPPDKPRKKADFGPEMTKDRALVILGMSTRQRARIGRELKTEIVRKRLKEKRRELGRQMESIKTLAQLTSASNFGGLGEVSSQLRMDRVNKDSLLVEAAASYLLQLIRADELTKDSSWKPGIAPPREQSKWTLIVRPKARCLGAITSLIAEKRAAKNND